MSWKNDPIAGKDDGEPTPVEGNWMKDPVAPQEKHELPKGEEEKKFKSKIIMWTPATEYSPAIPVFEDDEDNRKVAEMSAEQTKGGVKSFLQGATMDLSPKAQAAFEAVVDRNKDEPWTDAYHRHLDEYHKKMSKFTEENPAASWGTYGMGSLIGLGKLKAGMEALGLIKELPKAAPLAKKAIEAAKLGGTAGAASGLGHATDESLGEDVKSTAIGAGAGAALGAGTTALGERVIGPALDWVSRRFNPQAAKDQAVRAIVDHLAMDEKGGGATAQDLMDIIDAHPGKPLVLADVVDANTRGLARQVATEGGPGSTRAQKFLEERDMGAGTRLREDVNQNISPDISVHKTAKALDELKKTTAGPLYDEAYAHPENQNLESPFLNRFLQTPAGKKALADARVNMQNEMKLMGKSDPELTEQARDQGITTGKGVARGLKLETWDEIRQALGDQISVAKKAGEDKVARTLTLQKKKLTQELFKLDATSKAGPNSLKPEGGSYQRALKAYSGPSQSGDAMVEGTQIFKKNPHQIAEELGDLDPGDKEFYKLGAAEALRIRVAKMGMSADDSQAIIRSDWVRSQIRPLFDDEKSFRKFINSALAEHRMFETMKEMGTRARGPVAAEGHNIVGSLAKMAGGIATGEPVVSSMGMAEAAARMLRRRAMSPQVAHEVANTMFSPLSARDVLNRATSRPPSRPGVPLLRGPLTQALGGVYPGLMSKPNRE